MLCFIVKEKHNIKIANPDDQLQPLIMMQLQLKKLKTAGGEETLRFTAELYLDREKIAIVSNGGIGGGHEYNFFGADNRQLFTDYVNRFKTDLDLSDPLHQKVSEFVRDFQKTIPAFSQQDIDADIVVDCAIALQEELKIFNKQCKNKTLFRLPEDPKDEYRTVNQVFSSELESLLTAKYGSGITIVNKLLVSQR
jgi:hypothetical protein